MSEWAGKLEKFRQEHPELAIELYLSYDGHTTCRIKNCNGSVVGSYRDQAIEAAIDRAVSLYR